MSVINSLFNKTECNIALYGLGTETERFLVEYGSRLSIAGLLDGFKSDGHLYGYPIIPIENTLSRDVKIIIVIARPGSCKVIAKRIGDFCREHDIALYDVRGKNLLESSSVSYDYSSLPGYTKNELMTKIQQADIISFDLFDTLVTRTVFSYTDIFDILSINLENEGIHIPDFSSLRLQFEKELSKSSSPRLSDIYNKVLEVSGVDNITADELAEREFRIDQSTIITRKDMCDLVRDIISNGKKVVITTDCYYSLDQVKSVIEKAGIIGLDDVLVSCEYGTYKAQNLFGVLKEKYPDKSILHIGDDVYADVEKSKAYGIDSFHIYSGAEMFESLGGLGFEDDIVSLSDRIKVGMFNADIFNSPFVFEDDDRRVSAGTSYDVGYLFCAPMISDFMLWMKEQIDELGIEKMLFCSRDGYLPDKLFRLISHEDNAVYFYASRTAAIRSGMENKTDLEYVDSMKYFGTKEQALKTRYGIEVENADCINMDAQILKRSAMLRKNYKKYIDTFRFGSGIIGMFDFVAKGTTQMYLQKLFSQHVIGMYFLQLEPEFMADKGLDIKPFYTEDEKNGSAIFENYYILETILTSPESQLVEFDETGKPIYAEETRSRRDITVFVNAQEGIISYFERLISILPVNEIEINKKLDEKLLALINKVQIRDNDFLSIKVEDPFFGRMTDIKDVIG